ncbi:hypothetical protein [Pyrodictium occultum]|nr:hypothetical protein [Pyrodictium occultum]
MTLPKKEADLQKVVEEVAETHHEHEHHHHHHAEGLDELLHTIDVLMDTMNTRISDLEEKTDKLRGEVANLYRLFAAVVDALAAGSEEERKKALERAVEILRSSLEHATT